MKIRLITCCKNEEDLLPFFLHYYSSFVDQIIIYDGNSTDKSIEIAKSYDKVILKIDNDDELDDFKLHNIRNESYKINRSEWDWQIVVDIDEFLYHPNIKQILYNYLEMTPRITLPKIIGFDMYSETFPIFNNNNITDLIKTGKRNDKWLSKRIIFDPSLDINYTIGCHSCNPKGVIIEDSVTEFKLLHYCRIGYDHFIKKYKYNASRLSQMNKSNGYGFHIPIFATKSLEEFIKEGEGAVNII